MKYVTSLCAAVFAALFSVSAGSAATLSYTVSNAQSSSASSSLILAVDKFDQALGLLESARITVSGVSSESVHRRSDPTVAIYVGDPPVLQLIPQGVVATAVAAIKISNVGDILFSQSATDTDKEACGSPLIHRATCRVSAHASARILDASQLFTTGLAGLIGNAGDQTRFLFETQTSRDQLSNTRVSIEYTYTSSVAPAPVPLPASGLLLFGGLGLAGMAGRYARRRK